MFRINLNKYLDNKDRYLFLNIIMKILVCENIFRIKKYEYGSGVLVMAKTTGRFLLCKRGPDITEPNTWSNLGGGSEAGENPKVTATREFYEESGVVLPITLIDSFVNEKGDFRFYNFIGLVDSEFVPVVGKVTANTDGEVEVADYKWLKLEDIPKQKNLHWGVKKLYDNALPQLKNIVKKYSGKIS